MTIAEEDEDLDSLHEEDEFDEQQQLSTEELNQQLAAAVEKNDVLLLSESLERGADPSFRDEKHWNPLLWAAFYGHHEVSSGLLSAVSVGVYIRLSRRLCNA